MYRKILIAVDGSDCSMRAGEAGLDVARALGASAVILTVTPTWKSVGLSELAVGVSEEQFDVRTHEQAEQRLADVAELAKARQVACTTLQVPHAHPSEAIIDEAEKHGFDLIVMGSHGRRGATRLLLGSETSKVVGQGKTAVLVHRG